MSNASTQDTESSAEQIAWDKKDRQSMFAAFAVMGAFLTGIVGVMTWVVVSRLIPAFSIMGSDPSRDSVEFQTAQTAVQEAMGIVFMLILATLVLYWPLRFFGRYLDLRLGERPPAGGWVPYPFKSIDMTLEKISDTEQVAVVGKYEFKITTRLDKHLFASNTLSIHIEESTDYIENFGATGHLNLDVEKFTDEWIENTISKILEDYTDHFMELSYSI